MVNFILIIGLISFVYLICKMAEFSTKDIVIFFVFFFAIILFLLSFFINDFINNQLENKIVELYDLNNEISALSTQIVEIKNKISELNQSIKGIPKYSTGYCYMISSIAFGLKLSGATILPSIELVITSLLSNFYNYSWQHNLFLGVKACYEFQLIEIENLLSKLLIKQSNLEDYCRGNDILFDCFINLDLSFIALIFFAAFYLSIFIFILFKMISLKF